MKNAPLGPIPLFYSKKIDYRGYTYAQSEEIRQQIKFWFVCDPRGKFIYRSLKEEGGDIECKKWIDSLFHDDEDEEIEIIPRGRHLTKVTEEVFHDKSLTEDYQSGH